jgi:hypothetical protein
MNVYRRLLPGWKIIVIEADLLALSMGSLHCVTLNLYRIGKRKLAGSGEIQSELLPILKAY